MYWYYFQSARGVRIWWKKYITVMQIIQFVVDLGKPQYCPLSQTQVPGADCYIPIGFVYFASYTYFTSTYFPSWPNHGNCAGEEFAAVAGICILSSYLLLFISFYAATYRKPASAIKRRGRATSALKTMADEQVPTVGQTQRRLSAGANSFANGLGVPTGTGKVRSRKA
jgi:fatty acid elongase 3